MEQGSILNNCLPMKKLVSFPDSFRKGSGNETMKKHRSTFKGTSQNNENIQQSRDVKRLMKEQENAL